MTPLTTMRRRLAALAIVAALILPAQALGATAIQSTSETLTVSTTVGIVGLPASMAYGAGLGGDVKSAPAFTITASTNNATGMKVVWQATNLTSGPNIILATNRFLRVPADPTGTPCSMTGGLSTWATTPGAAYGAIATTDKTVCTGSAAGSTTLTGLVLSVEIPAAAVPGAYTGTTSFKAVDN